MINLLHIFIMPLKFHTCNDNNTINYFDLYFSDKYGKCIEISENSEWEICIWNNLIKYPYIKRPYTYNNIIYYDLASPYGYSGFDIDINVIDINVTNINVTTADFANFREEFTQEAHNRNYITEFFRFSPFNIKYIKPLIENSINIWLKSKTVCIDLTLGYDNYWIQSDKRHKRSVNKAIKMGYTTEVLTQFSINELISGQFRILYNETMKRLDAITYYYFSDEYFKAIYNNLNTYLIQVKDKNDNIVASCLYIKWNTFFHYHLGGSDTNHLQNGINNLLHDTAIKFGISNNLETLHLGGGIKDNDSLFSFKNSIGKDIKEFWQGKHILNNEIYDLLKLDCFDINYFPPYRYKK